MSKKEVLKGICHLYTETGTEGGYWAFEDQNFITKITASFGLYVGLIVWDKNDLKRKGVVQDNVELFMDDKWVPFSDPIINDPDYLISSLFCGEKRGDRKADKRLMKRYHFKIKYAANRMNERFGKGN